MSEHLLDHIRYLSLGTKLQQTSSLFVATVLLVQVRDLGYMER